MPAVPLLLEQITAQQAHVAVLNDRLQAAERAIARALLALEAAEQTLGELVAAHTAATRHGASAEPRRLRAVQSAAQDAFFDVG